MIRKVQIIFVSKTSRLWKIFTAFAYADIIGSTYIACRNKFLTKNKNISRTSRNVLLLLLCAKTTIVICSKEQLLAMIFVTDNLVYMIYISSKFIANFHDVSRNLDRYSCRMKFPRYIEILTNDFWQCSFLLSVNLTLFFFSEIQENCHQIESPPKKETDIVSWFAEAGLWNKFYPSRDFWSTLDQALRF